MACAFTAVTLLLSALVSCTSTDLDTSDKKWSQTSPAINLHHIFHGEINKKGKPTGFHVRPKDTESSTGARIARIMSKPNKAGVYTARVEVHDKSRNTWIEKFSTMFPDNLSRDEIITAITYAYSERDKSKKQPWSGPSGLGFPIQGYILNDGRINTAFPVYIRD